MKKVICFVGVVQEVEVQEDLHDSQIAAIARELVYRRITEGEGYAPHDFGVEVFPNDE